MNPKLAPRLARIERDEVLAALVADFRRHGGEAIRRMREDAPEEYCRLVASVMPEAFRKASGDLREMTDDELHALIWSGLLRQGIDEPRLAEIVDAWRSVGTGSAAAN